MYFQALLREPSTDGIMKMQNGCDTSETITLTDPPDLSGALNTTQQVSL